MSGLTRGAVMASGLCPPTSPLTTRALWSPWPRIMKDDRRNGHGRSWHSDAPFPLDGGGSLAALDIAYETYGELAADQADGRQAEDDPAQASPPRRRDRHPYHPDRRQRYEEHRHVDDEGMRG